MFCGYAAYPIYLSLTTSYTPLFHFTIIRTGAWLSMSIIAHCRGRVDEVRTTLAGYFHIDCSCGAAISFAKVLQISRACLWHHLVLFSGCAFYFKTSCGKAPIGCYTICRGRHYPGLIYIYPTPLHCYPLYNTTLCLNCCCDETDVEATLDRLFFSGHRVLSPLQPSYVL